MNLIELLGEELAGKVAEALKGKGTDGKDVELVIGNDGSYIPKGKLDKALADKADAELLAKNTKKALDDLKAAGDPAQLKADLETAQNAAKEAAETYTKQLAEKDLDFAVRQALTDAHDPALVSGLLDKKKLKLNGEAVDGLDDQLKTLRESKAFLFKPADAAPTAPNPKGTKPAPTAPPPATADDWNPGADSGIQLNPLFKNL